MNQQDREAADTILMMEIEEKVKMRIAEVIHAVIVGDTKISLVNWDYDNLISHLHMLMLHKTQQHIKSRL